MSGSSTSVAASVVRMTDWATSGNGVALWEQSSLSGLVAGLAGSIATSMGAGGPVAGLAGTVGDAPGAGGVLVGLDPSDDAAVVQLTDDVALVSTIDFFPPIVDDPADYGAIAAAHACSDVFAMGGRVVSALNVAALPERLPEPAIAAMFASAAAVVAEAGGVVAGGHTIRADEPLFGLAVQGVVHPGAVLTKGGAQPDDVLVLSKPIGTGVVLAGGSDTEKARAIDGMRMVNRLASERLLALGGACHAVTDVASYGLLGHAHEMAERSGVCLLVDSEMVPCYRGAKQLAGAGVRAEGDDRNRSSFEGLVLVGGQVAPAMHALAFDPQTSGGLLAAVGADEVAGLVDAGFRPIGTVREVDADDDGYATEPMVQMS